MTYEHILFDLDAGVARVTLNRAARLNALSRQTATELVHVLGRIRDDPAARVLLLTGEGRGFCSGADLTAVDASDDRLADRGALLETHLNPLAERLFGLSIPIVTAVNGVAAGAGCSLALAGDFAIAAKSAYFLQAFVNIGLVPDVGSTWLLSQSIGRPRALQMMMLGERVSADQALDWGMIYKVVPDDDLATEAMKLARRLALGPTVSYGMIRQGVRSALDQTFTESLLMERRNQFVAGKTDDFSEGVSAFLEKRQAVFSGR